MTIVLALVMGIRVFVLCAVHVDFLTSKILVEENDDEARQKSFLATRDSTIVCQLYRLTLCSNGRLARLIISQE